MDHSSTPTSRPVAGIVWMLVTGVQFIAVTALVKYVGADIPAPEAAFLRYAMGLIFLVPVFGQMFRAGLNRRALGLFGVRGTFHAIGVMFWFYAMTRIPLAEVTALSYLNPIFVTVGAALFLGERLAARRIAAVCVALVGALVILRPGARVLEPGHLAMLLNAVLFAGSFMMAKVIVGQNSPAVVVGWLSLVVTVVLFPFAVAVWVWPTWQQLAWLFLVAAFATGGHFTMTLAFRAAPLTVTQPVTFLQLVWSVLLGALVFAEPVDLWVVLGGTLVVGAVSFITWREAVLKRRAVTPPSVATKF